MYAVKEVSVADTGRLFGYMQGGIFGAGFNLKGFDYPWILSARPWAKGERVLDVGGAYSGLPIHIAQTYGCEPWVVDDFGTSEGDPFWRRHRDPSEHIQSHPEVRFVLERLGDPDQSSLPSSYFDCILSASALEHVPPDSIVKVWRHMDRLLRPGGDMLHALDVALPTSRGLAHVLLSIAFDLAFPVLPSRLRSRFVYETPSAYVRTVLRSLRIKPPRRSSRMGILNFVLNPEVLLEPPVNTYNRIAKDGKAGTRHFRVGSLLIHLTKTSADARRR